MICKPVVRRTAIVGSWIVGTGSKNSPVGDTSGLVLYAMRVTEKHTMAQYDEHCRKALRNKIPDLNAPDARLHVGDCIYDYSKPGPALRPSVHSEANRKTDLGGVYALLSRDFYYFGKNHVRLPDEFLGIVKQGQGHRSRSNDEFVDPFIEWVREQTPGVSGEPQMWKTAASCGSCRAADDEEDERLGETGC